MRDVLAAGVLFFVALFFLTTFLPSPRAETDAQLHFTEEEIVRGTQFAQGRKLLFWGATALHLAFLSVVVFSGFARRLTDALSAWTGGPQLLTALLVGGFCLLGDQLIALLFGLIRLEHLRAWGLTDRSIASWLGDFAIAAAVAAVLGAILLGGLYLLVRRFPRHWWLPAGVLSGLFGAVVAFVLPVIITPLFNTFTPLSETRWAALQERVDKLARRAELPVDEVLVMDASRQSYHSNAYFIGLGATRRIVLYDNLLKKHGPEEVESILAHEMGHWAQKHIAKGLVLATVGALLGFWLLGCVLHWAVGRPPFRLRDPADPAGVPLVLLLASLGAWLTMPVQNVISRQFERQADVAALELAGQPQAFIAAEKQLARDNISNVAPDPLSVLWFATHPPAVERIRMAEEWKGRSPKQ